MIDFNREFIGILSRGIFILLLQCNDVAGAPKREVKGEGDTKAHAQGA